MRDLSGFAWVLLGVASASGGCQAFSGIWDVDYDDPNGASTTGSSTGASAGSSTGASATVGGAGAGSGGLAAGGMGPGSGGTGPGSTDVTAVGAGASGAGTGGGCSGATKLCGDRCVGLDDPQTGCLEATCDACALPDVASHVCDPGGCAIGSCSPGHENCDSIPSNGCESDLATDPKHCGACDVDCTSYPNVDPATVQCQGGTCVIDGSWGCKPGYLACDNVMGNGCETLSTNQHCSSCGEVCASGFACHVGSTGALCNCTNDASCNWGSQGTCVPDPFPGWMDFTSCHCGAQFCGAPGRCGPNDTCKYF